MRISDWSSDVCSSDLAGYPPATVVPGFTSDARTCFDCVQRRAKVHAILHQVSSVGIVVETGTSAKSPQSLPVLGRARPDLRNVVGSEEGDRGRLSRGCLASMGMTRFLSGDDEVGGGCVIRLDSR